MKKVLLGLLAALLLALFAVLGLAATKPDTLTVQRSLLVQAAPADILPYAQDYRLFVQWIPWTALDPAQEVRFSEPPAGVGAWYTWKGNDKVGEGRMTILAVSEERVDSRLEFLAPWESTANSFLTARPRGDGQTEVTWGFVQENDGMSKVMMVFMDMDAMLGADFEKGLAALKPMVEKAAAERADAERAAAERAAAEQAAADAAQAPSEGGEDPGAP